MKPQRDTKFKNISELSNYSTKDYYCFAIVFSPETENDHFLGCPPYIGMQSSDGIGDEIFFEVPEPVAYYGKTHPCYTMQGKKNDRKQGERDLAQKIKALLDV